MTAIFAEKALVGAEWLSNVRITIADGRIAAITPQTTPEPGDDRHGAVVPAVANLHSHAFQRAMAGLAEIRGPQADNFWSWRSIMYRFALSMTPEQMEAIAAQLYMEMLEAGFSRVGEFHYLHHDKDGTPYGDPAEMAGRIAAASRETGIGLTLLPVFYAHAGFGGQAPIDGQRRFIHSLDGFARLMEACEGMVAGLPGARLGVAPHSLRAVTPDELARIVPMAGGGPVHIHVAEQVREVEDCIAWSGARPVEWLLANAPVDDHWCLIHATHMTEDETRAAARSGAVAGLCPITEANLGDGSFAAPLYLAEGGRLGIGSDSNVLISLAAELRQLEYSQRLALKARNVIAAAEGSTGARLFALARAGGAAALGMAAPQPPRSGPAADAAQGGLAIAAPADLVALADHDLPYLPAERLIDHFVFANGVAIDAVWVAGEKQVEGGRHRKRDAINRRFVAAMRALMA